MPSHFIYDVAYIINQIFPCETLSGLMNMSLEQFWDLATYSIISAEERKEENGTSNYVNNITEPMPIKNGGWF